jgi:hypothetical protein
VPEPKPGAFVANGCIDGGTPVGAPVDDFYGNPRDQSPDIGPVEATAPSP